MAKKGKKIKNKSNKKVDEFKQQLKWFTFSTCNILHKEIGNIDIDDVIKNLYLKSDDDDVQNLIKIYEKQLILFKLDEKKFIETAHKFYLDTNKYLKDNKLYGKFFELANLAYAQNEKVFSNEDDKIANRVHNAYADLLLQQYAYFGGRGDVNAYGVNSNGKLYLAPEYINNYANIVYYQKKVLDEDMTLKEYQSFLNKNGVKGVNELILKEDLFANMDKIVTNMCFQNAWLIDEHTKEIFPQNAFIRDPMQQFTLNPIMESENDFKKIKERLTIRNRTLPQEGITATVLNCGDVKEIYMKEIFKKESIVLLFKIKFIDDKYAIGFYNNKTKTSYTPWSMTNGRKELHIPLMNLILDLYADLTCCFDSHEEKVSYIKVYPENDEIFSSCDFLREKLPIVYYKYNENKGEKKNRNNVSGKNNEDYEVELRNVNYYTRKLPVGWKTSDEAKALAMRYGIELKEGETFVKGFTKKVYVNKK